MADRKFNIEVATSFSPTGTQQANQALQEVTKSTNTLGNEMEEGARKAEHSGLSHRELHKIFHLIATQAGPGAGAAIAGVGAATTASIGIALIAVKEFVEYLKKLKEEEEERRETAAAVWIAERDAIDESAKSAEDYAESVRRVKDASKEVEDQLKNNLAVLQAQIEAHKQILESIEKEQLAAAAGDKEKEENIRSRFDILKRNYDVTAESQALEKKRDDLTQRQFVLRPKLTEAATQAEADLEEEKANRAAADAKGRMEGKDEKKLLAARTKALEGFEENKARAEGPATTEAEQERKTLATVNYEAAKKIIDAADQYEKDKDTVARHEAAVTKLTKAKEEAAKVQKENDDAIDKESKEIKTGEDVLKVHRQSAARQNAFDVVDRAGGFANSDNIIARGEAAMEAYMHGQKLSRDQVQQIANMRALFEAVGGNSAAIINLIKQSLAHHVSQAAEIAQLQKQFANLRSSAARVSSTGQ
jgi:hypothetical protein